MVSLKKSVSNQLRLCQPVRPGHGISTKPGKTGNSLRDQSQIPFFAGDHARA
jgi:hypothetical protein